MLENEIILQINVRKNSDGEFVVSFDKKPANVLEFLHATLAVYKQGKAEMLAETARVNREVYGFKGGENERA
ncbi:hypothetical protein [Candidatus Nitrososphaera sp. FF02]|uniref:hypothetical protein n=1 Tax=Candidatus Nitrososphaera sp. FF02 TaxID=3398226 RepID=UPI0039ECD355